MQFSTLTKKINQERIGGAFLIFIQKKDLLLFNSFGFVAFKQFIIDNDSAIIDKMFFNLKIKTQSINHINLVSLTFSIEAYKKIKEKSSLENLTDTAKDFFHMIFQFAKLNISTLLL